MKRVDFLQMAAGVAMAACNPPVIGADSQSLRSLLFIAV